MPGITPPQPTARMPYAELAAQSSRDLSSLRLESFLQRADSLEEGECSAAVSFSVSPGQARSPFNLASPVAKVSGLELLLAYGQPDTHTLLIIDVDPNRGQVVRFFLRKNV